MGNFEPLPWALGMSKKFDLNGNELAITSLLVTVHILLLYEIVGIQIKIGRLLAVVLDPQEPVIAII
jgi:hypothetical protein